MKILKPYYAAFIILLFSFNLAIAQCGDCPDDGNVIQISEGVYGASAASGYYWDVCSGNAEIISSNNGQNVTVKCKGAGSSKLRVTRFVEGVCVESCITIECPPSSCPPQSCLDMNYQGYPQKCVRASIWIDSTCLEEYQCNFGSVQLSMYLANIHMIQFDPGVTYGTWDFPPGNWNGTQLKGLATFTCGDQECELKIIMDLHCYVDGEDDDDSPQYIIDNNGNSETRNLDGNYSEVAAIKVGDQVSFNFDSDEVIESVQVYNINGQLIDVSLDKGTNAIRLNNHSTGILKAIITTENGIYYSTFFDLE